MKTKLEKIIRELDPWYDFEKIEFHSLFQARDSKELFGSALKPIAFLTTYYKPILRGGFVGGIVGALVSGPTGDPVPESSAYVGISYAMMDVFQYSVRGIYHFIDAQKSTK